MPLLESPPLHRLRHSMWSCLFLSVAAAENATSKNSGLNLAFQAQNLYTSWTHKIEEKSCANEKKKQERVRDPYHATRIEDRRPPEPTAWNTAFLRLDITSKDVSLLQPDNKKNSRMSTSDAWVVGRWAQVTAKSHSFRNAAGSPAYARHARAEAPHRRSQYERLFKDTAPSPPHQKARAPRCRGARASLPRTEACARMFAGNT